MEFRLPTTLVLAIGLVSTFSVAEDRLRITLGDRIGKEQLQWSGSVGNVYFIQYSLDLAEWAYVPFIESGGDSELSWENELGGDFPQAFYRLAISESQTEDPRNDDFDGDRIGNFEEITRGTDPLLFADSNSNLIADDWERLYFEVLDKAADDDSDGDGYSLEQEYLQGSDPTRVTRAVRFQALIDGRSQLLLGESFAQWRHIDFAAPGLHEGQNAPTVINGVDWFPEWPNEDENRDCNCFSSMYESTETLIDKRAENFRLGVIQSRDTVTIVQLPDETNENTIIVEINDNGFGGSGEYIIELVYDLDVLVDGEP